MAVSLSLCLIVKNEERNLRQVLGNAHLYADEIVIVDTGSTDKTKEIASEYTKNIYDFVWCDNFSAARNFAISKCTKDFIIWLDADDMILDADAVNIKKIFEQSPLADVYLLPYFYEYHANGKSSTVIPRERIFRNNKQFSFIYPVHEILHVAEGAIRRAIAIPIYHKHTKQTEFIKHCRRNLALLLAAVKAEHYKEDMRLWWSLAAEYSKLEEYEKSLNIYYMAVAKKTRNLSGQQESVLHIEIADLLFMKQEWHKAQEHMEIAIALHPFWREPYFQYARLQCQTRQYVASSELLLFCKTIALPEDHGVLDLQIYNNKTIDRLLAGVYFRMGRIGSAIFSFFNSL